MLELSSKLLLKMLSSLLLCAFLSARTSDMLHEFNICSVVSLWASGPKTALKTLQDAWTFFSMVPNDKSIWTPDGHWSCKNSKAISYFWGWEQRLRSGYMHLDCVLMARASSIWLWKSKRWKFCCWQKQSPHVSCITRRVALDETLNSSVDNLSAAIS